MFRNDPAADPILIEISFSSVEERVVNPAMLP
jgi:hypothetical protein